MSEGFVSEPCEKFVFDPKRTRHKLPGLDFCRTCGRQRNKHKEKAAMSEIRAQLYAGNPLSITDEELDLLSKYPAIGNQRPQVVDNGDDTFDVIGEPMRTGTSHQFLSRVSETTARIYVDGHRYLPLFAHAVRELRQSMPAEALASTLCHTEDSGLFSNPEVAEHIAAFLVKHFRITPRA